MEDAGELIPWARKHLATKVGQQRQDSITLNELWPEPDWHSWCDGRRSRDTVARIAMLYAGLARSPKKACWGLSEYQWRQAYIDSIQTLRQLLMDTHTLEEVKNTNERFAALFGFSLDDIRRLPMVRMAPFFAAGRGSTRSASGPGSMTLRTAELARWLPRLGWPESDAALKTPIIPVKLTDGTWRVSRISGNRYYFLPECLPKSEEDAVRMAAESIEHIAASLKAAKTRAGGAKLARVGPDYRRGADVGPERVIKQFGVRGIQFGETLPDREARIWMNQLHEAMHDLADVLNVRHQIIGLGGLGVAIGARGKGGAVAHYEADLRVFNFTRANGAGSFAHEWAHAADHELTVRLGIGKLGQFLSEIPVGHLAICGVDHPAAHAMAMLVQDLKKDAQNQYTAYYKAARKLSSTPRAGNYWITPSELFARAFEAWIQDQLLMSDRISPYLVSGTLPENHEAHADMSPYPMGEERNWINARFDELIPDLVRLLSRTPETVE